MTVFNFNADFLGEETHNLDLSVLWARPPLKIDDSLQFQQIERLDREPIIRLFGVNEHGNSIVANVLGFYPYFFVPCPVAHVDKDDFIKCLNADIEKNAVIDIEILKKKTIYGYFGSGFQNFMKITCSLPKFIPKAKTILEGGNFSCDSFRGIQLAPFESNISYTLRFMIDCKVTGLNWIEIKKENWKRTADKLTTAQLEVDVHYSNLISHSPEGEWSKVAPLRILSFDIECAGRKGVFPDSSIDPVIQIASVVTLQGESSPFIKNVFTLNSCAHIFDAHILSYKNEDDLLLNWSEFFRLVDPDIVTGYNIMNFDWPYLLSRAETLKVSGFPYLGRLKGSRTIAKDTRFSSKAYGTRENKDINLDGRLPLDMLQVVQRDYKLRSYTLNSVSAHFLGEQKEDVHHSIISDLQAGDEVTRRRLAVYCLKDALLPQRLIDKLMVFINYMEMARVTGVPFNYLLTRGQQIKVVSQLYRKALEVGLVIPAIKSEGSDDQYEGATVIEPKKAYYSDPIATLDFSSLYPSIMMAHNLCYSTLILDTRVSERLDKNTDFIVTPSGDKFVTSKLCKGILPSILEDLISARKRAKEDLKKETDPFRKAVLDGRQLALKISANSVYGFTGATVGKLPCLQVSQSVTAYGRQMIEFTAKLVEETFTISNGYKFNADVIYGDTDSVMIKFGTSDLSEAMKLGKEAADFISSKFVKPIKLEFEKVYWPYLLINKKRYAGLYWTKTTHYDKMDTKGIETVRRDNCKLVQIVVETCLKKILIDKDVEGAIFYVKRIISDLLQNKIDLSLLVISKALSKSGDEYAAKQAHVELAERIKKRDAGSAPSMGDRVAYVIVKSFKGAAAYERSEDPIFVLDNNIPIDTHYYLENQLKKPLLRVFEPILMDAEAQLLSGEHTRSIQVSAPSIGSLSKFVSKKMTCLGCKAVLKDQNAGICPHCESNFKEIYLKNVNHFSKLELKYSRLWTQCQRCQGSLHQDVLCTSRDCPIFYMRKKIQKEASEGINILERFKEIPREDVEEW